MAACAEPEVHLIPVGLEGPVLIIFSDPNGVPEKREGRARRYDIPESGVFRTQLPRNEGWGRPDYEYVDGAGRRTPIVPGTQCDTTLADDPVQACLGVIRLNGNGAPSPDYTTYVVGHHANRNQMCDRLDQLADSVLFGGVIWGLLQQRTTPAGPEAR